jgi:hypothetical protein
MPLSDEEKAELLAAMEERFTATFDQKINNVLTARDKRLQASIGKTLAEEVAKLAPAAEKTEEKPTGEGAAKADPEVIKLREQVERLTRTTEEATKARADTEQKARLASTRTTLREALDAKGIKGARATAVLAMMEAQGALRFGDDGTPELVIKRARTKGAKAEELVFDDLAAGVEDWAKSTDAAEFLPAPAPVAPAKRPGALPARAPAGAGGADRAPSEAELVDRFVENMSRNGVSLQGD